MRLTERYWAETAYFPPGFCNRVIEFGNSLPIAEGRVRHDPKGDQRDSAVSWIQQNPTLGWLFIPIKQAVETANSKVWRFRLSDMESAQFTRYAVGQHYAWHTDQRPEPYPAGKRWGGLYRKLSVVISLSDGADFEGGDFLLEDNSLPPNRASERVRTITELRGLGSIIVFPSFLYHKVEPVTQGSRRTLVLWFLGPPFE